MKKFFIYLFAYIAGLVNGLLGSGGGTIALPMLYKVLNNEKNAHNNVCLFVLPLAVVSAVIYKREININIVSLICIGAFFGGIAGKIFSKKISINYLKIIFAIIIIYTGVKGLL